MTADGTVTPQCHFMLTAEHQRSRLTGWALSGLRRRLLLLLPFLLCSLQS